ncbi:MAG: hypothetical protein ACJA01_000635 [Saprospiraceae bacterium]|jgi:hypothetical protein
MGFSIQIDLQNPIVSHFMKKQLISVLRIQDMSIAQLRNKEKGLLCFLRATEITYQLIKIKAEQSFDFFSVKYSSLELGFLEWVQGGQFPALVKGYNLQKVQDREYWKLKGAQATRVTLYWTSFSEVNELTDNIDNLVVVAWDGDKWVNLGRTEVLSFLGTGTVTSRPFIPNQYSALTFGIADTDRDGYADGANEDPLDPCIPEGSSLVCQNRICVEVHASVYLEGAMHNGGISSYTSTMSTRINDFGYLPREKPKTLL